MARETKKKSHIRPHPKTGIYQYIRRVPKEAEYILGKWYAPSLGTRSWTTAGGLAAEQDQIFEHKVALAKQGKRSIDLSSYKALSDVPQNVRAVIEAEFQNAEFSDDEKTKITRNFGKILGSYEHHKTSALGNLLYDQLREEGYFILRDSPLFDELTVRFRDAVLRMIASAAKANQERAASEIDPLDLAAFEQKIFVPEKREKPLKPILAIFDDFKKEELKENTEEERTRFHHIVSNFASFVGISTPTNYVTRKQVLTFFGLLANYPPRLTVEQRSMSFAEITAGSHTKTISVTTAKEWYRRLHRLYSYVVLAHSDTHKVINVFEGMQAKAKGREAAKKRAWSPDEIRELFAQPEFKVRDSFFWSIICAVFHGNRLSEFHRRTVSELLQDENGIWYMNVSEGKTESSVRCVPIHQYVIDLGFLEFVEEARNSGSKYIFPHEDHEDPSSDIFSKNFGRYLKSRGLYDVKRTLHNFRNTFITNAHRCNIQGVPDVVLAVMRITGHMPETEHKKRYWEIHLDTMKTVIDQVRIEGFPYEVIK